MRTWVWAPLLFLASSAQGAELTAIDVGTPGGAVELKLVLDGRSEPRVFELTDPPRIVVDLPDVVSSLRGSQIRGDSRVIDRIRYSQFALEPTPVTRVVLDMVRPTDYRLEAGAGGVQLRFEVAEAKARTVASEPHEAPRVAADEEPEVASGSADTSIAETAESESVAPENAGPETEDAARITYMTVSTAYVSAGSRDGLSEGARLSVLRADEVVGTLEVSNVSTRRASCRIVNAADELRVGDLVGFEASRDGEAPRYLQLSSQGPDVAVPPGAANGSFRGWLRGAGFRGRLSARYLTVRDRSGTGQTFSQPAMDARVEGRDVGGSAWDMSLDVRTRRTYREEPNGESSQEGRSRVYRANATWKTFDSRLKLTVGRQYSPELSSLSIYDGASLVYRGSRMAWGVLSGSQPDPESFGYSNEIREHGVFARVYSAPGSVNKLSFTLGAIGSYHSGEINREYLALQSHMVNGGFSAYVSQDVDLNRGWKRDVEGAALSLNNTYASLRYRAGEQTTVSAGFDNRRSIRLYRDYISPETEFDDTYRQGVWLGLRQRFGKRFRMGGRVKRSTGGSAGEANTYTVDGAVQGRVRVGARSTRFENDMVAGWIHSLRASTRFGSRTSFEIGGGMRTQESVSPTANDETLTWTSFLADYFLGRSWYASVSFERSRQGPEANDQIFSMLNYRF